jgi:hypothetical protein
MGALAALSAGRSQAAERQAVNIAIQSPDNYGKVYLTWTAVPAWAYLAETSETDVEVVLTNDEGSSSLTPAGKRIDGDLAFSATRPAPGTTCTDATLRLMLPKSGEPVQFYLAGAFPQASTQDQDAVIEVRLANGSLVARRSTMVRIRKRFDTLTTDPDGGERQRFFKALASLLENRAEKYLEILAIHNWAARGKDPLFSSTPFPTYPTPPGPYQYEDQAHGGPAFLAWHRAFLLQVERTLQASFPDVALPYWASNQPNSVTEVFGDTALGFNPGTSDQIVIPRFADGHPLEFWQMPVEGTSNWESIQRFGGDPFTNIHGFSDSDILRRGDFARFAANIEQNPHNVGHNFTGPWMANCRISPRDPIFWVFHSWFDRMWADWQHKFNRFDRSTLSYSPSGSFPSDATQSPALGHYLNDTMWPWNDIIGSQANELASRPPLRLTGPFKASGVADIWPGETTTATPTPGDLIDYGGTIAGNLNMGYAYDDVPIGASKDQLSPLSRTVARADAPPVGSDGPNKAESQGPVKPNKSQPSMFLDSNQPLEQRKSAAAHLDLEADKDAVKGVQDLLNDPKEHDSLRAIAMRRLTPQNPGQTLRKAALILDNPNDGGVELDVQAVNSIGFIHMFHVITPEERHLGHSALRKALENQASAVRSAALTVLAGDKDEHAIRMLKDGLAAKEKLVLDVPSAIHLLGAAAGQDSHQNLRPFLKDADAAIRVAAISQLGSDAESRPAITGLLRDKDQPLEVRNAAIQALLYHDKQFSETAFALISDGKTPEPLRQKLIRAVRVYVNINPANLPKEQLQAISAKLDHLKS